MNTVGNDNDDTGPFAQPKFGKKKSQEIIQLKNIVLVGTKVDLPQKKKVQFSEAIVMCEKYGLAGCVETSSRSDKTKLAENLFDDLNDAFFMAACNCVDQTTRDLIEELNESV